MKVQGRKKRGRPKNIRWLDRVRVDIKENGVSGRECTTVLHGGVCHCISTPHKSGNQMIRKKKNTFLSIDLYPLNTFSHRYKTHIPLNIYFCDLLCPAYFYHSQRSFTVPF